MASIFRVCVLLVAATAFLLSLWIMIPGPTTALLVLSVGAPEVSPWLLGFNLFCALLALGGLSSSPIARVSFILSLVGSLISALPLIQFPAAQGQAEQAMRAGFGKGYDTKIPAGVNLRVAPFVLTDVFRPPEPEAVRLQTGIPFAAPGGTPLHLNLYRPLQKGRYPVVVLLYGGAWQRGAPILEDRLARYLAARGFCVFVPEYRHAPVYRYPAQLEDIRSALAFVRQEGGRYEADPSRIVLWGKSAGGHLAMLAAYQPDLPPVAGVVSYYGPIDLTAGYNDPPRPDPIDVRRSLEIFLGRPPNALRAQYLAASPSSYASRPLPPTLLVQGGRDHIVLPKFPRRLRDRLHRTGTRAALVEIPWADHAFDSLFFGPSNQLALYYTERFLYWAVQRP